MDSKKEHEFNACYRTYAPRIYGLAYRMVNNHQDALDIVQESFMKAYKNWEKFRGDAAISTWLFRITLNHSYDYLRKRQKEKTFEIKRDIEDAKKYFGESKIIKEDVLKIVSLAIEQLTPKQKAIFVLKTYDGLKYQEIARITHSRIGTVKATYFQVVQKLRKNLFLKEVMKNEL